MLNTHTPYPDEQGILDLKVSVHSLGILGGSSWGHNPERKEPETL